jgi:hypothetical protein
MSSLTKGSEVEAKSLKEWMSLYGIEEAAVQLPNSSEFQDELSGVDLANKAIDEIIHERTYGTNSSR